MEQKEVVKRAYYVRHPVSAEAASKIRALGYRVVDSKFKPEGYENPPYAGDGTKAQQANSNGALGAGKGKDGYQTVPDLLAELARLGIEAPADAKRPDLLELIAKAKG